MTENILEGPIRTNAKGKGFFQKKDGKFVAIDYKDLNHALDRDFVQIKITGKNKWKEETGKVLKVIRRDKEIFVGRIEFRKGEPHFVPDNRRFYPEVDIINLDKFDDLKDKKIALKLER